LGNAEMEDINNLKGEFGIAFVRAVVHAAGFYMEVSSRMLDADGVDIQIFHKGPYKTIGRSHAVQVQLKTTSKKPTKDFLTEVLPIKNYEELIYSNYQVPRILVVIVVPQKREEWVRLDEEELVMKHCGYWASFRGYPEIENTTSRSVQIPRNQLFNVEAVGEIMDKIARREDL